MCSACERTGWWVFLQSCHRPQNYMSLTSQEIGLSPCVLLSLSKGSKQHSFPPKCHPAFHTVTNFACISLPVLDLVCTDVIFTSKDHLSQLTCLQMFHFFIFPFQAAKPAHLPHHTTPQGLVAVSKPVAASPHFSDRRGSRDGREGADLCAAAATAQRWR